MVIRCIYSEERSEDCNISPLNVLDAREKMEVKWCVKEMMFAEETVKICYDVFPPPSHYELFGPRVPNRFSHVKIRTCLHILTFTTIRVLSAVRQISNTLKSW